MEWLHQRFRPHSFPGLAIHAWALSRAPGSTHIYPDAVLRPKTLLAVYGNLSSMQPHRRRLPSRVPSNLYLHASGVHIIASLGHTG